MKKYCPQCDKKNKTVQHHSMCVCSVCGYALGHRELEPSISIGKKNNKSITPFLIQ